MSNETITDKKLFICCSQNKRQYYKAKIRNFYLQGILLSDDIYDADIVLHIQDGRPDQHVCQEITIASERKLPIHIVDQNMMNRHLMSLLLDNTLYNHDQIFEIDRER